MKNFIFLTKTNQEGLYKPQTGRKNEIQRILLCISAACTILVVGLFSNAFEPLHTKAMAPSDNPTSLEKVQLGKILYFDKRLSADNKISCNTCHDVNKGGVDGLPTSKGIHGQLGPRNAPTVFNAAFLSTQFWDGREPSLEAQAKGPITNPKEMGMKDHATLMVKLKNVKGYEPLFKKAFPEEKDPMTIDNLAKAIGAYERTLITPNSPFDRFMKGHTKAMSPLAQEGMKNFEKVGCVSCHSGPNFSGPTLPVGTGFFMKFPTYTNNKYVSKYSLDKDLGRFQVTKNENDKHMWRVPTLRNIAQTAPYFHTGNVKSLDEAVRLMGKVQLNKDLNPKEVKSIVAFLKSLSGTLPLQKMPKFPN